MGLFNATNQWFALVMFLPGLLGQVVLPMLSESMGANNDVRSQRILQLTVLANAAVVVPLVLVGSLASPWLMSLYGEGFAPSWQMLVISLITAGVLAVQSPISQSLNAEGRLWTTLFLNLGWAAVFVGLTFCFIDRGATGLVSARLIAYLFQSVLIVLLVFRLSRNRGRLLEVST